MPNPAPTPNAMPGAQAAAAAQQAQQPAAGLVSPATSAGQGEAVPAAPQTPPATPPWGSAEEFNPERAWSLIQNVRTENTTLKDQLTAAQPILDAHEQQRRAEQGELDTAREDLTKATQRGDTWRDRALRSEARAKAAGRFIDADAALALIGDLSGFATDDGVDDAKLTQRLDQLAADKPHLVAPTEPQGFHKPNRGQGQSGAGPLTPAQIAAHAESQQDWRSAGNAKAQQLIDLRRSMP